MKKIVSIFLATTLVFVFGLFAVGSGNSSTDDVTNDIIDTSSTYSDNDFKVEIKSARLEKNYMDGKDVVVITYGYTNNTAEGLCFSDIFFDTVYQNGVELSSSFSIFANKEIFDNGSTFDYEMFADSVSFDNELTKIKDGASLDVELGYILLDKTSNVDVEVTKSPAYGENEPIKKTFDEIK